MPENEVATEQINEPVVFTKAENPGLFEAICKELHISSKSTDFLSSEDLDKVIALDLEVKHGANVTSLNGIEKLRNLSSFEIYGMSDFNKAEIMYYDIYRASAKDFETAVFQYNQVEDFSPLQKCSKLEWCTIASQRKIKTLNVGGLHNLQTLWINSCEKLSNISGLATSMSNGELKKYGVENCEKLRKIENDNKFCELLKNRHDINVSFDSKYFINLMRDKPELRTTLEALPDESVKWAEHGQPYSTKQMLMVYDRIADIVNTVCQEGESDIQKLANVYRYFCDTMTYDRSAEENSEDKSDPRVEAVKIANRRSLDVLFNNKGVCVGFSNIFNLCGEYLGFNMERCQCLGKLEEKEYLDERTVFASNHAISKLRMFNKETQKWEEYYFDLTWDLGSKKSKYFMLTREQIMEKHQLTIQSSETQFEPPAPNLQEELEQEGVLKTATVFTKEENPGLFDVACKHLGLEPDEVDGLTQHELNSIENLYLFPINKASNGHYMLWADVRSLAGIEKFHKLSKICIQGANGDDISKFRDDNNLQVAQELQDTLSERNQISDLSPLQNCPNLKSMLILEQNKVESIDVGKLKAIPELVVFRCDNLKEVINVAEYYDSNSEDDLTVVNCGNAKMFLGKGFISQEDEQEAGRGEQSQVEEAEQITTEQTASEEAGQVATESIEAEQVESFEAEQEPMIGYEQPVEQNFVYQEQPVEVFEQDSQPLGVAQEGAQCDASLVTDYKLAEQPADYEQSAEVVDPNYAYAGYVDPNYQENEYVEPNYQDEAYAEPLYAEQNADSADYLSAEVAQPNMVDAQYADPNQVQEVLLSEGGEQMQVGDGEQSSGKASEQELSRER